jgi:hypothetical protein
MPASPTDEQGTDPQLDELRAAGCATILEEHASGADRSRPVLARLLREIPAGETLVVVRLGRLARSVSHLLAVIEQLEASGAHFRSLSGCFDSSRDVLVAGGGRGGSACTGPLRERTKAGLSAPPQAAWLAMNESPPKRAKAGPGVLFHSAPFALG